MFCRLIRDCVPFLSPLTTRRDYGGRILKAENPEPGEPRLVLISLRNRVAPRSSPLDRPSIDASSGPRKNHLFTFCLPSWCAATDCCLIIYRVFTSRCAATGICWLHRPCLEQIATIVKVKVTLRPTISRPVRLGVRRPSGARDQFFYLLEIFF
jgi:hypothetical protein